MKEYKCEQCKQCKVNLTDELLQSHISLYTSSPDKTEDLTDEHEPNGHYTKLGNYEPFFVFEAFV